ncbi:hypothetical protein EB796_003548 [Bugula neritina]|uniref:Uncharacterized protein n=1 Tax=Bugula neritina TaxID=10212 RepID=A0A7J7KHV3_BUGNE|nr:hypothetical protein EB796_003548 [Bugula neritina]
MCYKSFPEPLAPASLRVLKQKNDEYTLKWTIYSTETTVSYTCCNTELTLNTVLDFKSEFRISVQSVYGQYTSSSRTRVIKFPNVVSVPVTSMRTTQEVTRSKAIPSNLPSPTNLRVSSNDISYTFTWNIPDSSKAPNSFLVEECVQEACVNRSEVPYVCCSTTMSTSLVLYVTQVVKVTLRSVYPEGISSPSNRVTLNPSSESKREDIDADEAYAELDKKALTALIIVTGGMVVSLIIGVTYNYFNLKHRNKVRAMKLQESS